MSPARAAGVTDRLWDVNDLVAPLGVLRGEGGKSTTMRILETVGGFLLVLGAAYCGWRALLLGAAWREKVHGKPEPPISILNSKKISK
jgi:hypothetical protein